MTRLLQTLALLALFPLIWLWGLVSFSAASALTLAQTLKKVWR